MFKDLATAEAYLASALLKDWERRIVSEAVERCTSPLWKEDASKCIGFLLAALVDSEELNDADWDVVGQLTIDKYEAMNKV